MIWKYILWIEGNSMNIAIIFAGGTGQRMNTKSKPKQFLEMHGKPVIIYTLEHFQNHPAIDAIVIVCLRSWIPYCKDLIRQYGINKTVSIVPGGRTGQESIFLGLKEARKKYGDGAVVLIHDGVRPLINEKIITDCLSCLAKNGNAITVAPAIETIFVKKEDGTIGSIFKRSACEMAKAPQCFCLKDIYEAHLKAKADHKNDFIDSADLMQHYGYPLHSVEGPSENIKITTPVDFYVFRALIDAKENL